MRFYGVFMRFYLLFCYLFVAPSIANSSSCLAFLKNSPSLLKVSEILLGGQILTAPQIEELELRMRPYRDSVSGFLGTDESLIEVLARDDLKVKELGTTHQKIADAIDKILEDGFLFDQGTIIINGIEYEYNINSYRGSQESPFRDGTSSNQEINIRNTSTGVSMRIAGLNIIMIRQYGFYQGLRSPYRVSPEDLVRLLPFILD